MLYTGGAVLCSVAFNPLIAMFNFSSLVLVGALAGGLPARLDTAHRTALPAGRLRYETTRRMIRTR